MMRVLVVLYMVLCISSCSSYVAMSEERFDRRFTALETYTMSDFDIYTYSICENLMAYDTNDDRFVICPDNFFVTEDTSLKKVEELYLLKHKHLDIVFYLTTTTKMGKDFLNDVTLYNKKFYANMLEFVYIAKVTGDSIDFKPTSNFSAMKWHVNTTVNSIDVVSVTTTTVERDTPQTIAINNTFALPFILQKQDDFKFLIATTTPKAINKLFVVRDKQGDIHLVLQPEGSSKVYRFSNRQIKYHPY